MAALYRMRRVFLNHSGQDLFAAVNVREACVLQEFNKTYKGSIRK